MLEVSVDGVAVLYGIQHGGLSRRFCIASSWRALGARGQRGLLRQKHSSSLSANFK